MAWRLAGEYFENCSCDIRIMEFEVEGLTAPDSDEVMEITGTIHPMGSNLPIARSLGGRYEDADFGLAFDNTGKNGHYREFAWEA